MMKRGVSISIDNASLRFRFSVASAETLKSRVIDWVKGAGNPDREREIWALRNISVEIASGERVGVIGANGSGKSSFFKVITGIYPVTEGRVEVRGALVPLFQLGLGFQPDLTVSENLLHSGALLGLSSDEMARKMSEILVFSELSEWAGAPLKILSSGMAMRLAFAAATAFRTDILLLDEVFTVGDASFVERAMRRLDARIEQTEILMVISHSTTVIGRLCTRVLWLDKGRLVFDGPTDEALARYGEFSRKAAEMC